MLWTLDVFRKSILEIIVLKNDGGELGSTGQLKCKWRVVVGQWATLKADRIITCRG